MNYLYKAEENNSRRFLIKPGSPGHKMKDQENSRFPGILRTLVKPLRIKLKTDWTAMISAVVVIDFWSRKSIFRHYISVKILVNKNKIDLIHLNPSPFCIFILQVSRCMEKSEYSFDIKVLCIKIDSKIQALYIEYTDFFLNVITGGCH